MCANAPKCLLVVFLPEPAAEILNVVCILFLNLCICVFVYANAPEYLLVVVVLPEPSVGIFASPSFRSEGAELLKTSCGCHSLWICISQSPLQAQMEFNNTPQTQMYFQRL